KPEANHVEEGTMGGPSFEQVLGERLREEGQRRSVNFAFGRDVASTRCYFSEGRDMHIAPEVDPRPMFNALFGGVDDVDPEMVRRRDIRTRSLDKVHSSMSS